MSLRDLDEEGPSVSIGRVLAPILLAPVLERRAFAERVLKDVAKAVERTLNGSGCIGDFRRCDNLHNPYLLGRERVG